MAKDFDWLLEKIDKESPGDVEIQTGQTSAVLFFWIEGEYLTQAFYDILGWCEFSTKNWGNGITGGLTRSVEMSHPRYPAYTADRVNITGIKPNGDVNVEDTDNFAPLEYASYIFNTTNPNLQVPVDYRTVPYSATYKMYRVAVTFSVKDYFPLTDEQLEPAILQGQATPPKYFYFDKTYSPAGTVLKNYYDFREMLRYTSPPDIQPQYELITNDNARLYFKNVVDLDAPVYLGPIPETPLTTTNTSSFFQPIVKNNVEIIWHKVPKETLLNPQYGTSVGMVNFGGNPQDFNYNNPEIFNYDLFNFDSGTLLLTGVESEEMHSNSSFPVLPYSAETRNDMIRNPIKNQFINIKFKFSQFSIPPSQLKLPSVAKVAKWLKGAMCGNGHNFVPNPNRNFYYIESGNLSQRDVTFPPYWSRSFQTLWNPTHA